MWLAGDSSVDNKHWYGLHTSIGVATPLVERVQAFPAHTTDNIPPTRATEGHVICKSMPTILDAGVREPLTPTPMACRLFPNFNQSARTMLADRDGEFTAAAVNGYDAICESRPDVAGRDAA